MRRLRKAQRVYPNGHSEAQLLDYMGVMIKIIPQGYDNYGFIIWNDESDANECVLIDVYDAKLFIKYLRDLKKIPTVILNTHWHCRLDHADEIETASLKFRAELVPGHTSGQVVYRLEAPHQECIFTGDFLFVGGIGRLFEGTDERLLSSLLVVKNWPGNSLIFPGHEFSKSNLRFAMAVEPENDTVADMYERVSDMRSSNIPAMPTELDDEFTYNPFLRLDDEAVVEGLESLGYKVPEPKTHKGRTPLDADVVDFNRKVLVLRALRTAKEDYDSKSRFPESPTNSREVIE